MPFYKTSRTVLDRKKPLELVFELLSFSGGENTIGADQELKPNEARVIKNWDATSLGGMIRSKGFNEVADGSGAGYTEDYDFLLQHDESGSSRLYAVIEGDLVYKSGSAMTQADNAAFTSGTLCHGVSVGDVLYITNPTDNIKKKTIGVAIAALTDPPTNARERLYYHKFRLIAEGGGRRVYGSRAGTGNFDAADGFSLANDAWNIDMPRATKGGCSWGNEFLIFTEFGAYFLYNFPDIAYRPIIPSHGCSAPYSIAKGNEGVFFVSKYPTLGVFLYNGANWINLTEHHDFVDEIDFSKRIFGTYRNNKYFLFYSDGNTAYPNKLRIYNAKFGRWMERPISSDWSDSFGYPALLTHSNNELYVGSSVADELYELETEDDSDEGENTEASYKTKDFSSADFNVASGGRFPIDDVRMKLLKITVTFYGTKGAITVQWTADRGKYSGSQTFNATAEGAKINDDFTVNVSKIIAATDIPDKTVTKSFANKTIGRRFNFEIGNINTGTRPEVKKIKISAIALEEA